MNNKSFKTILYASDLGKNSKSAFEIALNLASTTSASLLFMHVVNNTLIEEDEAIDSYISDALFKKIKKSKLDIAAEKIEKRLIGTQHECPELYDSVSIETLVTEGRATSQILKLAEYKKADLIIMGSRTHTSIGGLLIGSTASKVMQQSKIPVMVIPL